MAQKILEPETSEVESAVLRKLGEGKGWKPIELLEALHQFSSAEVKLALAQLLHDGKIELTSHMLRVAA